MTNREANPSQAAVLGHPIAHTLSPAIFEFLSKTCFTKSKTQRFKYHALDIPPEHLGPFFSQLKASKMAQNWVGFNITIPHKEEVISHLDRLTAHARATGAVNVVKLIPQKNGKLHFAGHNSDVFGLLKTFQEHRMILRSKTAVIFGAGGAARAAAVALAQSGAKEIWIFARRKQQANRLRRMCQKTFSRTTLRLLDSIQDAPPSTAIFINATPLGMQGYPKRSLLPAHPAPGSWALDLVYRPAQTAFLRDAKKKKLNPVGGLDMLIWQAFATWKIFFGFPPPLSLKPKLKRHLRILLKGGSP